MKGPGKRGEHSSCNDDFKGDITQLIRVLNLIMKLKNNTQLIIN
jgi:hypothetical protein